MNRFTTEQELPREIVTCAAYSRGRRVADVELPRVHDVLKEPDQFVWIALHEPSGEVLAQVQQEFGLHNLAVEDAHNAHQRPRMERYGDSVFVVLRTAQIMPAAALILAKRIFRGG